MGWLRRFWKRWQTPRVGRQADSVRPAMDDRDVLESIADFDEDPDVRRAARELLLEQQGKPAEPA